MRTKSILIAVVLTVAITGLVAAPAVAQRVVEKRMCVVDGKGGYGKGGCGKGMMPEFTAEQKEQIGAIKEKYEAQRVALANRAKAMNIEMTELLTADEPDFKAIEKKIDDFAKVHTDRVKLRLKQHQEIRGLLDKDQKTIFDAGLCMKLCDLVAGGKGHGKGHGGCGGMMGGRMGCGTGGKGGCGMGGGMMGHRMMGKMGCGMGGMMGEPGTRHIIEMHIDDEMDMDHEEDHDDEEHGSIDIHEIHPGVDPNSM
jgi:Spy/CpxP family protein refolding chaperone